MSLRIPLQIPAIKPKALSFFRYGKIDDFYVLTNDAGEWHCLSEEEFKHFVTGQINAGHAQFEDLKKKSFLRKDLDVELLAQKVRQKKAFLGQGPHLHIVITTLRCNQSCKYCHASRADMDRVDTDMSLETAKGIVELAMDSTSPYICFEYTGGEPTVNMPVIRYMIEYAKELNKDNKKFVEHSLVTNMTYMNEENAEYIMDNDVWVCTSLDGPAELHDWNRGWRKGGSAYNQVLHWIQYFNRRYKERGKDPELYHVDALMTTTRKSFDMWRELVDLYVELGIRNIHIRPLNPFGFASKTWRVIGYTMDEYMQFYSEILQYIIDLNYQGIQIMEGTAAHFLKKMLTPIDPNFVDIRSPIGSGTGQVAYGFDGKIYPSDEGRMVGAMGDEYFELGEVGKTSYFDVTNHSTTKTLAISSLLDSLPMCHNCWNAPFCGVRPMHNYMQNKDLFGQRPMTAKCQEHMTIAKLLFRLLRNDKEGKVTSIFQRWIIDRPRT